MFVDQFDQEHSRDIEPMRGGHGDDYYYQFVSYVRRYKGARPLPPVRPAPTVVDGQFADWHAVEPEFRDTLGDPVRRRHRGWDPKVTYENQTGRNDLVAAKVSFDSQLVAFYLRAHAPFLANTDPHWLVLFLDVDGNSTNGWLGYDFRVTAPREPAQPAVLERRVSDTWHAVGSTVFHRAGAELELTLPWSTLGLETPPAAFDFKWADHGLVANDWTDFTLHGDAAPNDRFNYRAVLKPR
jgi:hypothetical protein